MDSVAPPKTCPPPVSKTLDDLARLEVVFGLQDWRKNVVCFVKKEQKRKGKNGLMSSTLLLVCY